MIDVKNRAKLYSGETIIQIQICRGADDRPFIVALTNIGRILSSEAIHGQGGWEVTELPERMSTDLDTIE
jgi:hypothetical protein